MSDERHLDNSLPTLEMSANPTPYGTPEYEALVCKEMVQKGTADPLDDAANSDSFHMEGDRNAGGANEAHSSICFPVMKFFANLVPAGSLLSCGFNVMSTSVGAGILGLPDAFRSVGTVMGVVYLLLVTVETVYSMKLLVIVAEKTGLRTYEEMGTYLLGEKSLYVVAAIRILHTFGACIAYVVTIGNLITPIVDAFAADNEDISFLQSGVGTRLIQSILWLVFFLPVALPRRLNSLRHVSAFGIVFMIMFSLCIIAHSSMHGMKQSPRPSTSPAKTGNGAVEGLGVFIFSYMCQVNAVELYLELSKRGVGRFTLCATISLSICALLYILSGLFGYLDFGESVTGSILLMYNPLAEPQFFVCFIGVFIKITASYGLLGAVCRSATFQLCGTDAESVSRWKHLLVSVAIAVLTLICGLFIPNINTVFGFLGGFCGGFIGFILPALFFMYSGNFSIKESGLFTYLAVYLVLIAGVFAVVFGTGSAIYGAI